MYVVSTLCLLKGYTFWLAFCVLCVSFCHPVTTDETSFEAGIKVQIHSQDEPPFIDQLGFGVAPGFQTFVSCQQQLVPNAKPTAHSFILISDCTDLYESHICTISFIYPWEKTETLWFELEVKNWSQENV